eukprot:106619_1
MVTAQPLSMTIMLICVLVLVHVSATNITEYEHEVIDIEGPDPIMVVRRVVSLRHRVDPESVLRRRLRIIDEDLELKEKQISDLKKLKQYIKGQLSIYTSAKQAMMNKTTSKPSFAPTLNPTFSPTHHPTLQPTHLPTFRPTHHPTRNPTSQPTLNPTCHPTRNPTRNPTPHPTLKPTKNPTNVPIQWDKHKPKKHPKHQPNRKDNSTFDRILAEHAKSHPERKTIEPNTVELYQITPNDPATVALFIDQQLTNDHCDLMIIKRSLISPSQQFNITNSKTTLKFYYDEMDRMYDEFQKMATEFFLQGVKLGHPLQHFRVLIEQAFAAGLITRDVLPDFISNCTEPQQIVYELARAIIASKRTGIIRTMNTFRKMFMAIHTLRNERLLKCGVNNETIHGFDSTLESLFNASIELMLVHYATENMSFTAKDTMSFFIPLADGFADVVQPIMAIQEEFEIYSMLNEWYLVNGNDDDTSRVCLISSNKNSIYDNLKKRMQNKHIQFVKKNVKYSTKRGTKAFSIQHITK